MFLVLGAGTLNQGFGIKTLGLRQDRGGNLNGVVAGKQAQDLRGRARYRSQTDRQEGP